MRQIGLPILIFIILAGLAFYIYNNSNGVGTGLTNGANTVHDKVSNFNYDGTTAPGSGQTAP